MQGVGGRLEAGGCKRVGGHKGADSCKRANGRKRGYIHLLQISILIQIAYYFISGYALIMIKNKQTTTSIENGIN